MKKTKKFSIPTKPNRTLSSHGSNTTSSKVGNPWTSAWNSNHRTNSTASVKSSPAVVSATPPEVDENVNLSQKQSLFFDLISQGKSVFITGAAGTGAWNVFCYV